MAEQHSSKGIMIATIVVAIILTAIVVPFSMKAEKSAAGVGSGFLSVHGEGGHNCSQDNGHDDGRAPDAFGGMLRGHAAYLNPSKLKYAIIDAFV